MKTFDLSLASVVLGALAVSYSACSAQGQDNSIPGGTPLGHAGAPASSAGTSNASSGAAPVGAAGSAVVHPSAGAPPAANGGGFNTGVGGATTSLGGRPGSAGAATGGSGAPATNGCQVKAGTITDLLIDDLDDGDNVIKTIGSRSGYWYTFNDGLGTQVPDPNVLFKPTAPGRGTPAGMAATTSGSGFTKFGAGMGFDFNNTASKSCPYDASAYTGIKFWAKANTGNMTGMTLKAMIKIPATTPSTQQSGTCTGTCEDHFYLKPAPALTATWAQYTLAFASIAQDGFGTKVMAFDKAHILAVQFQVAQNVKFDFSVDDVTFY